MASKTLNEETSQALEHIGEALYHLSKALDRVIALIAKPEESGTPEESRKKGANLLDREGEMWLFLSEDAYRLEGTTDHTHSREWIEDRFGPIREVPDVTALIDSGGDTWVSVAEGMYLILGGSIPRTREWIEDNYGPITETRP